VAETPAAPALFDLRALARAAAGAAAALGLVAALGAIAHCPLGEPPRESALRLALRTQQAKLEVCRDRTAEELARLPAHMRQRRLCRPTAVDYRLTVEVDGARRLERVIAHRGVRRNRPLVVDELIRVAPGLRRVAIEFVPIPPDAEPALDGLPAYRLDEPVEARAGRIRIAALRGERLLWLPERAPAPAG
jgi:hypothetical protein